MNLPSVRNSTRIPSTRDCVRRRLEMTSDLPNTSQTPYGHSVELRLMESMALGFFHFKMSKINSIKLP